MTKTYRTTAADAVLARFPPARRAKIKARAADIVAEELALSDLRKSKEMTQEEVAERLGGQQVYVSRLERRSDMKLSTLRDYIKAIARRPTPADGHLSQGRSGAIEGDWRSHLPKWQDATQGCQRQDRIQSVRP